MELQRSGAPVSVEPSRVCRRGERKTHAFSGRGVARGRGRSAGARRYRANMATQGTLIYNIEINGNTVLMKKVLLYAFRVDLC